VSADKHVLLTDLRIETAVAVAQILDYAGFPVSTTAVDVY
jgi:hypothetical protein